MKFSSVGSCCSVSSSWLYNFEKDFWDERKPVFSGRELKIEENGSRPLVTFFISFPFDNLFQKLKFQEPQDQPNQIQLFHSNSIPGAFSFVYNSNFKLLEVFQMAYSISHVICITINVKSFNQLPLLNQLLSFSSDNIFSIRPSLVFLFEGILSKPLEAFAKTAKVAYSFDSLFPLLESELLSAAVAEDAAHSMEIRVGSDSTALTSLQYIQTLPCILTGSKLTLTLRCYLASFFPTPSLPYWIRALIYFLNFTGLASAASAAVARFAVFSAGNLFGLNETSGRFFHNLVDHLVIEKEDFNLHRSEAEGQVKDRMMALAAVGSNVLQVAADNSELLVAISRITSKAGLPICALCFKLRGDKYLLEPLETSIFVCTRCEVLLKNSAQKSLGGKIPSVSSDSKQVPFCKCDSLQCLLLPCRHFGCVDCAFEFFNKSCNRLHRERMTALEMWGRKKNKAVRRNKRKGTHPAGALMGRLDLAVAHGKDERGVCCCVCPECREKVTGVFLVEDTINPKRLNKLIN